MDWIQQWQSKLNKQNGVAPLVRTGGSRHTGLAALPYRNIHFHTESACHVGLSTPCGTCDEQVSMLCDVLTGCQTLDQAAVEFSPGGIVDIPDVCIWLVESGITNQTLQG